VEFRIKIMPTDESKLDPGVRAPNKCPKCGQEFVPNIEPWDIFQAPMNLPAHGFYRMDQYSYSVEWSEEDQEYVGLCKEFPGLSWLSPLPTEALKNIRALVIDSVNDIKTNNRIHNKTDVPPIPINFEDKVVEQCLNCGFQYVIAEKQLNVAEVNELREAAGLPPLVYLETCPNLSTEMITLLDEVYAGCETATLGGHVGQHLWWRGTQRDKKMEVLDTEERAKLFRKHQELDELDLKLAAELKVMLKYYNKEYPVKDFLEL
jgi:hypothetical protein